MPEDNDIIDWDTFNQIKEMDDGDDDFVMSLVLNFYDQAEDTFQDMDNALGEGDLAKLSSLGHFLKGSSAALGFKNIQSECEKIQHLGAGKDETGTSAMDGDDKDQLDLIKTCVETTRTEYTRLREYMNELYPPIE